MQPRGPANAADPHAGRRLAVTIGLAVVATAVYFVLPIPGRMREASWAVLFSCGVVVLGVLILLAIRRLLLATEGVRIRGLVLLLVLSVLYFSWCDDSVAVLPGQFAELHTKIDALYFTVSTLTTVGFGDVHAAGQLARAAVTIQIVFNLVFIGLAAGIVSGFLRSRARRRLEPGHDGTGPVPDGQDGAR
ncbi:MAG: potassium channel family protein [Streptosporangiaceae bacterium]